MTIKVNRTHSYDASLDAVAVMLRDPAFRKEVSQAQGARDCDVSVTGDYPVNTIVVSQTQEAREIPPAAAKLIGDAIRVVQTEEWNSPAQCLVTITLPKMPAQVSGTITLAEADGTTSETVEMEVTAKVPLIGGKLEEMMAALVDGALLIEERVGDSYLSR